MKKFPRFKIQCFIVSTATDQGQGYYDKQLQITHSHRPRPGLLWQAVTNHTQPQTKARAIMTSSYISHTATGQGQGYYDKQLHITHSHRPRPGLLWQAVTNHTQPQAKARAIMTSSYKSHTATGQGQGYYDKQLQITHSHRPRPGLLWQAVTNHTQPQTKARAIMTSSYKSHTVTDQGQGYYDKQLHITHSHRPRPGLLWQAVTYHTQPQAKARAIMTSSYRSHTATGQGQGYYDKQLQITHSHRPRPGLLWQAVTYHTQYMQQH